MQINSFNAKAIRENIRESISVLPDSSDDHRRLQELDDCLRGTADRGYCVTYNSKKDDDCKLLDLFAIPSLRAFPRDIAFLIEDHHIPAGLKKKLEHCAASQNCVKIIHMDSISDYIKADGKRCSSSDDTVIFAFFYPKNTLAYDQDYVMEKMNRFRRNPERS